MVVASTPRETPVLGPALVKAKVWSDRRLRRMRFSGSAHYWDARYASGGTSGSGWYNRLAVFKAEVLNDFVVAQDVRSVIEWGCGDGNQLLLARYPEYLGIDVSPVAIETCRRLFAADTSERFALAGDYDGPVADVALSLDVIYHLVEDDVFEQIWLSYSARLTDMSWSTRVTSTAMMQTHMFGTGISRGTWTSRSRVAPIAADPQWVSGCAATQTMNPTRNSSSMSALELAGLTPAPHQACGGKRGSACLPPLMR